MEPRFPADTEPFTTEPEAGVIPRPRHESDVHVDEKAVEPTADN